MFKWTVRIASFLVLGAMLNIAAAWGFAVRADDARGPTQKAMFCKADGFAFKYVVRRTGYTRVEEQWPLTDLIEVIKHGRSAVTTTPKFGKFSLGMDNYDPFARIATGWPMLAVRAWEPADLHRMKLVLDGSRQDRVHWGFVMERTQYPIPNQTAASIVLPLRPIAVGFTINTVFYALLLALLIYGPGALKRRIRLRRGQCLACGYPGGDSEVCTECGTPLVSAIRPAQFGQRNARLSRADP